MIFITILLIIFLIMLIVSVGFVVFYMFDENKKLKNINEELQKKLDNKTVEAKQLQDKLDTLMKQPSFVGLSYKTDKENLQQIIQNIKNIFVEIQEQSCPMLREAFLKNRQQYIDSILMDLKTNPKSCSEILILIDARNAMFAQRMSNDMSNLLPLANKSVIEKEIKEMLKTFISSICTNNSIDIAKVNQFLLDVFKAICYD